ncbi:hypothetical protein L2E82_47688 [Cichorium intybus]|uniref:Uncharacterized protein n=1 Tax=Cichorium intybus TaxID=13427 RepID=A0ACB8YVF9_CICIN|nr:hypothetical protein L2E82_47688 [Cichorium intybus]
MASATDNPVNRKEVALEIEPPAEFYHEVSSAIAFFLKCIRYIVTLLERLGRLWMDYYPPIFGVIMLPPPLNFVTTGLVAFAEMKSQGSEFPFKSHPGSMNVAVTSLLVYGLVSAAEHFISATRLGPASVYAIVAHSGRIVSLSILVASVASLFYFRSIGQHGFGTLSWHHWLLGFQCFLLIVYKLSPESNQKRQITTQILSSVSPGMQLETVTHELV